MNTHEGRTNLGRRTLFACGRFFGYVVCCNNLFLTWPLVVWSIWILIHSSAKSRFLIVLALLLCLIALSFVRTLISKFNISFSGRVLLGAPVSAMAGTVLWFLAKAPQGESGRIATTLLVVTLIIIGAYLLAKREEWLKVHDYGVRLQPRH